MHKNNENYSSIIYEKPNENILNEFIEELELFLSIRKRQLSSEDALIKCRKKYLNYAKHILYNYKSFYKHKLDQMGCKLELIDNINFYEENDYSYYIIKELIKYINGNNKNLIPKEIDDKLYTLNTLLFNPPITSNNIDIGKCLIDELLSWCLCNSDIVSKKEKKEISKDSFYVVIFNKLENSREERYTLVYNYIKYNKIFFNLYYAYAMLEQRSLSKDKTKNVASEYFFLLDSKLNPKVGSPFYEVFSKYKFDHINRHEKYIKDKTNTSVWSQLNINLIGLYKFMTIKLLTSISLQDMSFIISNLVTSHNDNMKPRQQIASKLYGINGYPGFDYEKMNNTFFNTFDTSVWTFSELHNDLSRFIFIVSDVRDLIKNINESTIYKDTNPGPNKEKGRQSMIGNILYEFDKSFRYSMYNHYLLYNKYVDKRYSNFKKLNLKKFSYNNIHCNLGYCKW